ncbi:hypothetical protein LCM18_10005 [Qipengyuania flava]|nr:hypothetical protein LCM18_10005 [Qipengyuania flava]
MADSDAEFEAIQSVFNALKPLDEDAQARVVGYVTSRLGLVSSVNRSTVSEGFVEQQEEIKADGEFEEFGELFDAFDPRTDAEKALVAAYWGAVYEEEDSFDSQSLNTMLKNLGHGVTNITRALGSLSGQKPALVIQTRKSGTSKQARKTFKITRSGISEVQSRLG